MFQQSGFGLGLGFTESATCWCYYSACELLVFLAFIHPSYVGHLCSFLVSFVVFVKVLGAHY